MPRSRASTRRKSGAAGRVSVPVTLGAIADIPNIDAEILAFGPRQLLQGVEERGQIRLRRSFGRGAVHQHTDTPHLTGLLRARRERPRRRAAE